MQGVLFYFFRRVRGGESCVLGKKGHLSVREKTASAYRRRTLRERRGIFMRRTTQKLEGRETDGAGAARGLRGEKNDFVRVGKARKI